MSECHTPVKLVCIYKSEESEVNSLPTSGLFKGLMNIYITPCVL